MPLLARPSLHDEMDQELAARHLREFVRQAWPVVEPSTPFVPGWHIDAIVEDLEAVARGQIRNLLINIPPRHIENPRPEGWVATSRFVPIHCHAARNCLKTWFFITAVYA